MLQQFQAALSGLRARGNKMIVAVSGGLDSMVLACLLHQAGVELVIAHCNFGLRGAESDGDEQLVRTWAVEKNIPCYVKKFETKSILEERGGNLQETARVLRYEWFEALRLELGADYIATAHHAQDSVETMLINFFKGTGIAGLHGIQPKNNNLIRPLLSFYKEDIRQYALRGHIPWREDSSNQKDDYTRNAVRLHLLPLVENIFPGALHNLEGNTQRFREVEMLYRESVERYRSKLMEQRGKDWYLPVLKLRNCRPLATIVMELIHPFGFSAAQVPDVLHLLDAETGKYVSSATHRIIRNRNFLIITSVMATESAHILVEEGMPEVALPDMILKLKGGTADTGLMKQVMAAGPGEVYIDKEVLTFPLIVRPWKTGDYFYPLGMNRKKKKVSRFLIDQKIPLHEKPGIYVVESNKKIVWIVGLRLDERFKIKDNTTGYFHISLMQK
jgi:tRNA(Ile)-lysidine synthase